MTARQGRVRVIVIHQQRLIVLTLVPRMLLAILSSFLVPAALETHTHQVLSQ